MQQLEEAAQYIRTRLAGEPEIGLILGFGTRCSGGINRGAAGDPDMAISLTSLSRPLLATQVSLIREDRGTSRADDERSVSSV